MKNINITVENKRATVVGSPVIICGNSDYTVTFAFDNEWSLTGPKTARFVYVKRGEVMHEDVPFSGNTVAVPVLSDVTFVNVGVFAGDLSTTTPAKVNCHPSILCGSGIVQAPTPDVYSQIMALFESMSEKGAFGATEEQMQLVEQNRQDIAALADVTEEQGQLIEQNAQDITALADGTKKAGDANKLGGHGADYFATAESVLFQKVSSGADVNTFITQGLYYFSGLATSYANAPSSTAHNGIMEVYYASDHTNIRCVQRWTSCNENKTYERVTLGGDVTDTNSWKPWKVIATTADLIAELAKYLPLTGGTLAGDLYISRYNNGSMRFMKNHSATADYGCRVYDISADGKQAGIGWSAKSKAPYFIDSDGKESNLLHIRNYSDYVLPKVDAAAEANSQSNVPMTFKGGAQPAISLLEFLGSDDSTLGRIGFRNGSATVSDSTKMNYYDIHHDGNSAKVHVGTSAPSDTTSVWFDTSDL